jgi:hypothetical protein
MCCADRCVLRRCVDVDVDVDVRSTKLPYTCLSCLYNIKKPGAQSGVI